MRDWSRRPLPLMCEMCSERREDVQRFGLIRRNVTTLAGHRTTQGAGGISLCRRCWEGINCHRQRVSVA